MNLLKTLIIFDWDDTLYPTIQTVINQNRDEKNISNLNYEIIDNKIYKLFNLILGYGKILIITDASKSWVVKCLQNLENTKKIFNDNQIKILSTIDIINEYNLKFNKHLRLFKEDKKIKIFDIIDEIYKDYNNIISIGDSKKEYAALSYIFQKSKNKNKLFKTIKFYQYPTSDLLLKELKLLYLNFFDVYKSNNCEDLIIR